VPSARRGAHSSATSHAAQTHAQPASVTETSTRRHAAGNGNCKHGVQQCAACSRGRDATRAGDDVGARKARRRCSDSVARGRLRDGSVAARARRTMHAAFKRKTVAIPAYRSSRHVLPTPGHTAPTNHANVSTRVGGAGDRRKHATRPHERTGVPYSKKLDLHICTPTQHGGPLGAQTP
jgi:hypothetical protein